MSPSSGTTERPNTLAISISRPRPTPGTANPAHPALIQQMRAQTGIARVRTGYQHNHHNHQRQQLHRQASHNHIHSSSFHPPHNNQYKQQSMRTTNPYFGVQQQVATNNNGASEPSPFDAVKFPARTRGVCKSESDKSPPGDRKPVTRAMSTVAENRSILDTPMGEDRDAHPTLVTYDPSTSRVALPPSVSDLEREFLK